MNCSLKNLHKSLKIRIFECGSEQRTANSEQRTANSEQRTANKFYNKQPYLSIKKSILGKYFSPKWIFLCVKN